MIATHFTKVNGKWYRAGQEIPAFFNAETPDNEAEENHYTRTDINRMPVDELRKLAGETGIDGAESMNGADIKKALIDALSL